MYPPVNRERSSVKSVALRLKVPLNGSRAFVTGWGRCDMTGKELCLPRGSIYYPGETFDPMLRTIMFQITLPNYFCKGYKRQEINLHPGMLCLGEAREENPVAPCLAVPGAPLVIQGSLAGIQSWGFGCGYSNDLPLVYTSIEYYEEWIWYNIGVLNSLLKTNYTQLFDATKAYISYMWLLETRELASDAAYEFPDYPEEVELADIDDVLTSLRGKYYDIRDYINEGRYHEGKYKILDAIWVRGRKLRLINKTKIVFPKPEPFIMDHIQANSEDEVK